MWVKTEKKNNNVIEMQENGNILQRKNGIVQSTSKMRLSKKLENKWKRKQLKISLKKENATYRTRRVEGNCCEFDSVQEKSTE